ncbi:MAG TPA: chemotaxis protein CheB [Bryobacteraceae bacterium]|nr:chemotaxis protein CheB [Bryobacteraceae bacterium]
MTPRTDRGTRLVLVADRSAALRQNAVRALQAGTGWACETACTIREARDKIVQLRPEVLALEADMPGNEQCEFVRRLTQYYPMPVILLTTAKEAPAIAGADMTVLTRFADESRTAAELARTLGQRTARQASYRMIAIGASTGGTEAVERVLQMLPPDNPGIVIAQHIPRQFSSTFAIRLNRVTPWEVREATDGLTIRDGMALVAPGDRHMRVALAGDRWVVRLDSGPKVWHQRPAVDILFESVAQCHAPHAVGVLLTGMGQDGAAGLRRMREAGYWTIAQDEASCVVFGMPRAAIEADAVCEVARLDRVAAAINGSQTRRAGSSFS